MRPVSSRSICAKGMLAPFMQLSLYSSFEHALSVCPAHSPTGDDHGDGTFFPLERCRGITGRAPLRRAVA